MTDGIIQKTIDKYRKKTFITKHAKFEVLELKDLNKLQQELIENIKQAITEDKINGFMAQHAMVLSKAELLEKLIGDNQE